MDNREFEGLLDGKYIDNTIFSLQNVRNDCSFGLIINVILKNNLIQTSAFLMAFRIINICLAI